MPRIKAPGQCALHGQSVRVLAPVLAAGLLLGVSACAPDIVPTPTGSVATPSQNPSPTATVTPVPVIDAVTAAARQFAEQTTLGNFDGQWTELAAQAQAMWPGQVARTALLAAKFAIAPISGISLGPPTPRVVWYDPESPDVSVAGTWRFPVSVAFADPDALNPPGVGPLFSMLSISVEYDSATGAALVVDEGPASIDAPIVVPGHITAPQVNVPIFMYHEIQAVPRRVRRDGSASTAGRSRSD